MAAEVRAARDDTELDAAFHVVRSAFLERPDPADIEWRRPLNPYDRVLIALDDGTVCGTAVSFPTEMTMPGGGAVTTAAVTSVGVLPTHRRRGHLSRLMELQLADVLERGDGLAALIAAEWPIYGRYGYGMAMPAATYELDSGRAQFVDPSWHGTVELVTRAELREVAPPVFAAHHAATPGAIARSDSWWDRTYGTNTPPSMKEERNEFWAVHRDPSGHVDGYATYQTKQKWDQNIPTGSIEVPDLITTSRGAYADLWRYLAEIDWTHRVKAWARPVDEPLGFLLVDGRHAVLTNRGDHIWLRVLDVANVLETRCYRGHDRLVLEVVDETLGRGGRFALDGSPDGASCTPTTEAPDLTLPVSTLGAGCVGGTSFAVLAAAGLLDEHSTGAIGRADGLFGWTPAPWCSTGF